MTTDPIDPDGPAPARDAFEATFVLAVDPPTAWRRLTARPLGEGGAGEETGRRYWLPGFDSAATVTEEVAGECLRATKDDQPCAGTDIVVTLAAVGTGTRITVVQSGFGDWLPAPPDIMAVGWRHIVADLHTYLATGAHARRHLRGWGDLGADAVPAAGGMRVHAIRPGTLADRLGLRDGDLLVVLAGAPVSGYDDLVTVLRVLRAVPGDVAAEWVRHGEVCTATAMAAA
ncbi:MAG TPA: hypothetical protein VFI47_11920 [Acidimicrobiales bacterium]|nr:hypothetical protein [Acidimicrobiales bacterium]